MAGKVEEMQAPKKKLADPERHWWSAADVATFFDVSEQTVLTHAKKGVLPSFRLGHQWRFKSAQIMAIEGRVTAA